MATQGDTHGKSGVSVLWKSLSGRSCGEEKGREGVVGERRGSGKWIWCAFRCFVVKTLLFCCFVVFLFCCCVVLVLMFVFGPWGGFLGLVLVG